MEMEKATLISLALEFGFDEVIAKKGLDRLVLLYGDDGQDFITVEHCVDDFLVALAESMEDTEDWDDLQALESEACGTLADMFENDFCMNYEPDKGGTAKNHARDVEDSPEAQKRQNFMQLDSASDSEDPDFTVPSNTDVGSAPSSGINKSRRGLPEKSSKHPSNSELPCDQV